MDAGCPRRTPDAPDAEEERQLTKVHEMQSKISAYVGARKDINDDDIEAVVGQYGSDWGETLPIPEFPTSDRDQGLYRRYTLAVARKIP